MIQVIIRDGLENVFLNKFNTFCDSTNLTYVCKNYFLWNFLSKPLPNFYKVK